jgi:hypothetical protein
MNFNDPEAIALITSAVALSLGLFFAAGWAILDHLRHRDGAPPAHSASRAAKRHRTIVERRGFPFVRGVTCSLPITEFKRATQRLW